MNADEARAILTYDAETGVLTWARRRRKIVVGQRAGSLNPNGYRTIRIDGKCYKEHRVIWLMVHGEWPKCHIDHVNGITHDNRLCNLREASRSQNLANSCRRRDNTSGFKGVASSPIKGKWMAYINKDGVRFYLGSYPTRESAHAAYRLKATELFGRFARIQ